MKFELENHFFDKDNNSVIVKAGTEGWQILYADGTDKTVEKKAVVPLDNFNEACEYAVKNGEIVLSGDEQEASE